MKASSPILPALATLATAALFSMAVAAQTPQGPQTPTPGAPKATRVFPAPTNLKVLAKDLNGQQVHEIMEQWEDALGAHCSTCHKADPNNIGPNGKPRLDFADDSKPEKETARKMFGMTMDINKNYVAKIDSSGAPVTCGTCHRGHLGPEPFVAPPDDHMSPKPPAPTSTVAPQFK